MLRRKILIFASGSGSNFEAIIEYFRGDTSISFELLTDKEGAGAIEKAKRLGIKWTCVKFGETYDFLAARRGEFDLFVLAGYMRILPERVLTLGTFINIHPSLLPKYKGVNSIERAFEARESETGVSVHFVVPEVDSGEIIVQKVVPIEPGMTLEALETAVHKVEHEIYPPVIKELLSKECEMKYNVLVYGSGGRENALAWKISQSPLLGKLFLALPNDGFSSLGEEIKFSDFEDLAKKAVAAGINLAVIGPEDPLSRGIVDVFNAHGIKCIGANKKWARLESSKKFAKEFMVKHAIPTAKYCTISSLEEIDAALANFDEAPVLKADGLAAGKGVHLSTNMEDARATLRDFLGGKYGEASSSVVVEETLTGEELSVISIYDGQTLLSFVGARDYKRLHDGQIGPNTGGMGAYCPVELTGAENANLKEYLVQLEAALIKDGADFSGIIYSGIMLSPKGIRILEYNMRFGDPETQPLLSHLDCDLLEIFIAATQKRLSSVNLKWKEGSTVGVVVASSGYPENPKKGCTINGLAEAARKNGTNIFYAGVTKSGGQLLSSGGRVLTVCASGTDINKVRASIYKTIDEIDFSDKIFRTDIAVKAVGSAKV